MFTDQRGVLLCWEPSSWSLQPAAWTGHVRALSFCMDRGKNSMAVLPPHATTWKSCWMGFLFSLILSQSWNIAVLSTGIHTAFCGIAGEGSVELKSCLTDCLCVKCIYLPCLPACPPQSGTSSGWNYCPPLHLELLLQGHEEAIAELCVQMQCRALFLPWW